MAFIFGGNTPWTYETLKKKREIADALLMANSSTPKNVGEGLNAIGRALTVRGINKRADKRDAELKGEFDAQFNAAFGGYGSGGGMGGGGVSSGAGYAPTGASASPRPVDPNSPTALGDETMAALGKAPLIANSDRLAGVDPRIEEVLSLAASNLGLELGVSEGLRDIETQKKYVAEGKSQTMNSKHLHGNAADFHLIGPDGQPNWDFEAYRPLAEEAKRIAAEKGYTGFEWGGDWKTLKDGVHFQFDGHDHSGDATVPATPGAAPSGGSPAPQGGGMPQGMDLGTLASLAANPYATPGQKAVINALMEQQMKAMDPMYQLQLQQQQLELAQARNPETKLNDYDMRAAEALQYGLQAGTPEYQAFVLGGKLPEAPGPVKPYSDIGQINADLAAGLITPADAETAKKALDKSVSVSVGAGETEFDKTLGKADATAYDEIVKQGVSAGAGMSTLDAMEASMADPNFYSGSGAGVVEGLRRAAVSMGIAEADSVTSMESFNALAKNAALTAMGGSLGAGFSNADRDFVEKQVPTLGNTPEGNREIIRIQKALLKRKQEMAQLAREYANDQAAKGERFNQAGFEEIARKYAEENPLFGAAPATSGGTGELSDEDLLKLYGG